MEDASVAGASAAQPAPPPPAPEPLTPERAAAENRRNDLFIIGAVLVTSFLLGSFRITDADLWLRLKTGWLIDQQGVPKSDSFSYSTENQPWVNPSWLFDWGLYQLEATEAKIHVRNLVADYRNLLTHAQEPQIDAQGKQVASSLSDESKQQIEKAIAGLADTARTNDTYQMRLAAERTAAIANAEGLSMPRLAADAGRTYPALAAYSSPAGQSLIQFASGVVAKCMLLVAIAAMLLCVRHPGPTGWWTATITAVALIAMSNRFNLSPSVFGLFGVAATLWIVHAYQNGRLWCAWLLIPLELLWVNVDSSFPLGFVIIAIVLVCQVMGQAFGRSVTGAAEKPTVLAAAFAIGLIATLANPFGLSVWSETYDWTRLVMNRAPYVGANLAALFGSSSDWVKESQARGGELLSISPDMFAPFGRGYIRLLQSFAIPPIAAALLIVAAFLSFALNRARFRMSRLLILLLCVGMYVFAFRYVAIAAMAAGVVLSLNGQEWYLDRFGSGTRITRGWWIWSQAGRALTVLAVVAVALAGITGWLTSDAGGEFGYGVQWVQFDLEPGKVLRQADLKGKVFNTVAAQGNLLIWSNYPSTQVYIDSRESLHHGHLKELETLRLALRGEDKEIVPVPAALDDYGVTTVMLNMNNLADTVSFLRTFARMNRDPKWRLVQLSSNNATYGRVDLEDNHPLAPDAAWFMKNAFDPARLVYAQDGEPLPEPPGPVAPPTWIDVIWRRRRIFTSQAITAGHYLSPAILRSTPSAEDAAATGPIFVVPTENCFLAIRDARRGLAKEARVSPLSYAVLSKAYYYLYNTELFVAPHPEIHDMRSLQVLTALNQLVAARPDDPIAQLQLTLRYRVLRYIDLADRHMDALLKLLPDDARIEDFLFDGGQRLNLEKTDLIRESENLKNELERVQYDMEQAGTQLANPMAKANYLMSRGCPAKAIEQLNEAQAFSIGMDVSPLLARLYVRIGQPGDSERGADHEMINIQGLGGMRPGEKEELWALVKIMQGDYDRARTYMEAAIADTRINLAKEKLMTFTNDLRAGTVLNMAFSPADSVDDVDRLIRMEHHLGLMHLEAGEPSEAAKHLKQALSIRPDCMFRPVIGFYLSKITGEKLEPLPNATDDDSDAPAAGPGMPAKSPPSRPAELPEKPTDQVKPEPEPKQDN
jgi:tetratricopeptide (TPR) repeat protein